MAHGQARCPEGLKMNHAGVDGWLCQRVSPHKDSKLAPGSVKILLWLIIPPGWRKPESGYFWSFCGFCCQNDEASHRFQDEDTADCLQSQFFERREKENEQLGWLTVWKSAVHRKPIAIVWFAAHSTTSAKSKMKPPFGAGLYITYRAILNMGLYNGNYKWDCWYPVFV